MIDAPISKNIVLREPHEIDPRTRPTASLCLALPSRTTPSSLLNIGPLVDEVVLVLVDSDESACDSFRRDLEKILEKTPITIIPVDARSHPHLYRMDVPETFNTGQSLAGEIYPGPHTGLPFVADWSAVRNLGLAMCTSEWRLCMEPDDVLHCPEQIDSACLVLNEHRRDVGYTNSRRSDGLTLGRSFLAARLSRNLPAIRFEGSARESLEGGLRPAVLANFLQSHQPSSSTVATDTFKILYAEARANNWDVPPVNLLHMAQSARSAGLPSFMKPAIDAYLASSLFPEERAWACALRGEIEEDAKTFSEASMWYQRSLEEHPGSKSAFRLARSRFHEERWQDCLDAHDLGIANQDMVQLSDDGPESASSSLVYAAAALQMLNRHEEAHEISEQLLKLFPSCPNLIQLCGALR